MSKSQTNLDGVAIDVYDGRFAGRFDIDEEKGRDIAYDDVVCFVVVATAGKAQFGTNKVGELKRSNVFDVTQVKPVDSPTAFKLMAAADIDLPGVVLDVDDYDDDDYDVYYDEVTFDPTEHINPADGTEILADFGPPSGEVEVVDLDGGDLEGEVIDTITTGDPRLNRFLGGSDTEPASKERISDDERPEWTKKMLNSFLEEV